MLLRLWRFGRTPHFGIDFGQSRDGALGNQGHILIRKVPNHGIMGMIGLEEEETENDFSH
jgi:hypothetical protein